MPLGLRRGPRIAPVRSQRRHRIWWDRQGYAVPSPADCERWSRASADEFPAGIREPPKKLPTFRGGLPLEPFHRSAELLGDPVRRGHGKVGHGSLGMERVPARERYGIAELTVAPMSVCLL